MSTFAPASTSDVEQEIISTYENLTGTTLYDGDPVRLFLCSLAYTIATQNNLINLAAQQNTLSYATEGHLDDVASLVSVTRLEAASATCYQSFSLAEPLAFNVVIPYGTRVTTADSATVFATNAEAIITAGETSVTVMVTAETSGTAYNGLVAGQIQSLVDPIAYISATANTTTTSLGADIESDDSLRARAQIASESFSCAGPVGAYRARAMAAHQSIADVAVWSPTAGTVDIRPILENGELPTDEILELVYEAVNADDVRPLTDTVTVNAPDIVEYSLTASWTLAKSKTSLYANIAETVATALETYRLWQRSAPGRDINPTKLISLMEQAGAQRVVLGFDFVELESSEIARETEVVLTYLGSEEG